METVGYCSGKIHVHYCTELELQDHLSGTVLTGKNARHFIQKHGIEKMHNCHTAPCSALGTWADAIAPVVSTVRGQTPFVARGKEQPSSAAAHSCTLGSVQPYELSRPKNGFRLAEQYLVNGNELRRDPHIKLIV